MEKSKEAREIYITSYDLSRLEELLENARNSKTRDNAHLDELEKELLRAEVVEPKDIPSDVITMNSTVKLKDLDSGQEMTFTLVFPPGANVDQKKISIMAPIGTAMLGYREGDIIEWEVPSGCKKLQVISVLYQPEASGNYDM